MSGVEVTWQTVDDIIEGHFRSMDHLAAMLIEGVTHDPEGVHDQLWVDVVQRMVDAATVFPGQFSQVLRSLKLIPALTAVAVLSIAATRRNREGLLIRVVTDVEGSLRPGNDQLTNAAQLLHYANVLVGDFATNLPRWAGSNGWLYPASHLFVTEVRRFFADLIPADADFEEAFRGFEYRMGLIQEQGSGFRAMSGEYVGEWAWVGNEPRAEIALRKQADRGYGDPWTRFFVAHESTFDTALTAQRDVLKRYQRW